MVSKTDWFIFVSAASTPVFNGKSTRLHFISLFQGDTQSRATRSLASLVSPPSKHEPNHSGKLSCLKKKTRKKEKSSVPATDERAVAAVKSAEPP